MSNPVQYNVFNRPPRIQDVFHSQEVTIPSPPDNKEDSLSSLLEMVLPMMGFLVMGFMYSFMYIGGSSGGSGLLFSIPMIAMGVFTLVISYFSQGEQKYRQRQNRLNQLRDYHRLLDKKEARLLSGRLLQKDLLERRHPAPDKLIKRAHELDIRLWERRKEDMDAMVVRLGRGEIASCVVIKPPDPDFESPEIRRAYNLFSKYRSLPQTPVTINLCEVGSVGLVGPRFRTLSLSRAIICQAVIQTAPSDMQLFVFSSELYYSLWRWLRWLPHANENQMGGNPTNLAFTRENSVNLMGMVAKSLERRRNLGTNTEATNLLPTAMLLFDDDIGVRDEPAFSMLMQPSPTQNTCALVLCEELQNVPSGCQAIIECLEDSSFHFSKVGPDGYKLEGIVDQVDQLQVENLAHRLLPMMLQMQGQGGRIPTQIDLLQVYDVNDISALQIMDRWFRLPELESHLPKPVGIGSESQTKSLVVNFGENKDGPHGIIAGTTGSGKSELLQTIVTALALEHHPYFLNFLLIDFKGESAFNVFNDLPHFVGKVSNLDKISALRSLIAIKAEVLRRQNFLKRFNAQNINDYYSRNLAKDQLTMDSEPIPHAKILSHLFIIVDEFAQMAQEMPEFIPQMIEIARLGRSIGIHLILSTQRPAGVVSDELRANLNFRISLRVQTIEDSRDLLPTSDAAFLPPNLPGRAYILVGEAGIPRQFQSARVASTYEKPEQKPMLDSSNLYILEYEDKNDLLKPRKGKKEDQITLCSELVGVMREYFQELCNQKGHRPLDKILLPPLTYHIDAVELMMKVEIINGEPYLAWNSEEQCWLDMAGHFRVPVGLLDDLAGHDQPLYWIDFLKFSGHLLVVGSPKSGKTDFLLALVYALSQCYRPSQLHIYVISFAGRELEFLETSELNAEESAPDTAFGLPHVGAVIQGNDIERLHRLIHHLQMQLEIRKARLAEVRAQDLTSYNSKVERIRRLPNICILIDNIGELRKGSNLDELEQLEKMIQTGRAYGLHFIVTALQSGDISYQIMNLIQQRIALNLIDLTDYISLVGRPDSFDYFNLPPGRCLVSGTPPLYGQLMKSPETDEWNKIITQMHNASKDELLPAPIGILPSQVYLSDLVQNAPAFSNETEVEGIVGLDDNTLETAIINWKKDGPHFLVGGPSQSGRTSFLHTMVLSAANQLSPEEIQFVLVDGTQGSLKPLARLPHVIDWVFEEVGLTENIANFQKDLEQRGEWVRKHYPDGLPAEARLPFPKIVFVIDDYDLTQDAFNLNEKILNQLGRQIRQDSNLGFHFLISMVTGGTSTGYDALINSLRLMRSGISLQDTDMVEILGGHVAAGLSHQSLPEGRGFLISRSGSRLIQFAFPDPKMYSSVMGKWEKAKRAKWVNPASKDDISKVADDSEPDFSKPRKPKDPTRVLSKSPLIDMKLALELWQKQNEKSREK